jgi:hypothetical protein
MGGDSAVSSEHFEVAVQSPHADFGAVRTDFRVDRWDAEQTAWVLRRMDREADTVLRRITQPRAGFAGQREPVSDAFTAYGVRPYSTTIEENCNLVVLGGWAAMLGSIAGTSITNKFSASQGRIGVGTSSTAAAATQTFLQGDTGGASTTSYYQLVSGAPTISTGSSPATLVFTASFGTGNANFAWAEFGTDNWSASGVTAQSLGASEVFFNRGVSSQGTKASGQTWTATETIQFGFPSGSGTVS